MASRAKQHLAVYQAIKRSIIAYLDNYETFLEEDVIKDEEIKRVEKQN